MKKQNLINQLTNEELKNLCAETKETIVSKKQLRRFTSVDLWHIRKNIRTSATRVSPVI